MLQIYKGENLSQQSIIVLLYGEPDAGKTSTAFTAEAPIVFDFDGGAHRSKFKKGKDIIKITDWGEVEKNLNSFPEFLKNYKTIVVDTIESMLASVRQYKIDLDSTILNNRFDIYNALFESFERFTYKIRSLQKDIIFIAHASTEEKFKKTIVTPKITGQSKDIVKQKADYIGYMFWGAKRSRMLQFNASQQNDGKNPGHIPTLALPDYNQEPDFMANLLIDMKRAIDIPTGLSDTESEFLKGYQDKISALSKDDINAFLNELASAEFPSKTVKKKIFAMLKQHASEFGLIYKSDLGMFDVADDQSASQPQQNEPRKRSDDGEQVKNGKQKFTF